MLKNLIAPNSTLYKIHLYSNKLLFPYRRRLIVKFCQSVTKTKPPRDKEIAQYYEELIKNENLQEIKHQIKKQGYRIVDNGYGFRDILYLIVRIKKPEYVIETGVSEGLSSLLILQALQDNKKGKLYSIDLPGYLPNIQKKPGWIIPDPLKKRWKLELGKSKDKLYPILNKVGSIDIFLHDSEHTYKNMLMEYETVYPFLNKEGILLSHDINLNSAFSDFSLKVNRSYQICRLSRLFFQSRYGVIGAIIK